MTVKLYTFINDQKLNQKNVAGFLSGAGNNTFKYWESDNPLLPAFVNCLQGGGKNKKIYTNYAHSPWVEAGSPGVKGKVSLKPNEGDGFKMVTLSKQTDLKWPKQLFGSAGSPPLSGGLHTAAVAIEEGDKSLQDGTRQKGLKRALRYYMLAAYSLLDIGKEVGFEGLGNMVGALLVSDKGEILASGINTGSYRHAEVSMLLSYFRKKPEAKTIPAKSIIFSTLTPCKQCTSYLTEAKGQDTVIYFGQSDTGKSGKAGEKIASKLSSKTDAPSGRVKEIATTESDDGNGVISMVSVSNIHKVKMAESLTTCLGGGSIAKQIGSSETSREILRSASDALIHKVMKDRANIEEEEIKSSVLRYLTYWLSGASLR